MAGLRRSAVEFRSRDAYITAANPDDSGRVRYTATSPVFGASVRVRPALHAYAAYGHGFETPTFNELGYRSDGGSGLNFGLQPARTRSGELGLKLDRADGLRSELALFRADTRDELTVATSAGGRSTFQNAGRARRVGAEWSASVPLSPRWQASLALTYVDARLPRRVPGLHQHAVRGGQHAGAGRCAHSRRAAGHRVRGIALGRRGRLARARRRPVRRRRHGQQPRRRTRQRATRCSAPAAATASARRAPKARVFLGVGNLFDRRYAGSVIVNESNRRYYEPAPGRNVVAGVELRWRD